MKLWHRLAAWFHKQSDHVKVAIVTVLLGGPMTVITGVVVYLMTKEAPQVQPQLTHFMVMTGEYRFPPVEKMTPEQQKAIRDMRYMTVAHVKNETTTPLLNVVVSLPKEGIAEIVDKDDASAVVQDFKEKVDVPLVPGMETKTVYFWHKDKMEDGQTVTIGGLNVSKTESMIRYYSGPTWDESAWQVVRWCAVASWFVFLALLAIRWFFKKKKTPATQAAPPPSPVPATAGPPVQPAATPPAAVPPVVPVPAAPAATAPTSPVP
jgi:hypothetical protein